MTLLEALVLGIIQGITEPLPVSSSGHLVIIPALLPGFHQPSVLFDVIVHLGTLTAVLFFLRREIAVLLGALPPRSLGARWGSAPAETERRAQRRVSLWILVATAITALIGLPLKDRIEALFENVSVTALMLLVTGAFLFWSDRIRHNRRGETDMTLADGIAIGLAQTLALVPGISRSGATIACAIFRGLERRAAARFSFLLSLPAIAGAVLLKAPELLTLTTAELPALAVGFAAAAVTGLLSLNLLFALLHRVGLKPFAFYCWLAGTATLLIRGVQP